MHMKNPDAMNRNQLIDYVFRLKVMIGILQKQIAKLEAEKRKEAI